ETVYQLPIPTDDADVFKNGMQIMRDWAQDATLDPVEIDKERGVVLEEKRLGKGAGERMQRQYLPLLLNNSRYSNRLPIGTEEVLKNAKPETIRQFYKDWYRPDMEALIIVGDIDVSAVEAMIKAKFSDLKNPANEPVRTEYKIPLLNKNQFIVVTDNEMPGTSAEIMIKHPEMTIKTTDDFRNSLIRSLYNQMTGARFSELTKQADPPFIQGSHSIGRFLAGLDAASASVNAKPGELERGLKAVWRETERIKKFGFTQTELDRAKQSFMTYMESAYKERDKTPSSNYVEEYLRHFLEGEASPGIEYEYKFYQEKIGGVTLADVNALAKKYLTDVNRDVMILGPEKDKSILPDEAKVNSWLAAVQAENITAYNDQVSAKPFMAKKPVAGKVIIEKNIPEIGVKEWTLSNGVKVVLKPTDFKNDEISFYAFSPGGTSLYSDADYQSASSAAGILARSGVGEYSSVELSKYMTGKRAGVSPYISERYEGISGGAIPKDFETALQLTYLYFTQPRTDPQIFTGIINQQKAALANREKDPASVFADTVAAVLGNYNI
ncbi:MAG TPA: peptidase M16, partial [Sphingobacteriaceae bacterium]|nr:peptidase M16 [Sphingobacteriaceae bacterium]